MPLIEDAHLHPCELSWYTQLAQRLILFLEVICFNCRLSIFKVHDISCDDRKTC